MCVCVRVCVNLNIPKEELRQVQITQEALPTLLSFLFSCHATATSVVRKLSS